MRKFTREDLSSATELFNQFYGAKYRIGPEQLAQNSFDSGLLVPEGSFITDDGSFVLLKRSPYGFFPGPEEGVFHILALAYSGENVGASLIRQVEAVVREQGGKKLWFGADLRHFFPGVPDTTPELLGLLSSCGFQPGAENVDLERDLVDYSAPKGTYDRVGDAEFRACTASDVPLLDEFFRREFPRRWHYDVMQKIEIEARPEIVFGVFVDGACEGFALTQEEGCRYPVAGAAWHHDLGAQWGSLGPIGVSERVRGRGLGGAILAFGLEGLRDRGVRRCIIDWTTLVEFYGKHGFIPNRRYMPMSLDLS